ncbi:hypothetical protein [Rhodococcus kronopolitis]|uniref:Metallo-beta-lactamase superfamily protein n=1 Tax=Rhodococcus kronopolitis TaxID=1460226 RepID=A0ABV9FN92_9NOCA
MCNFPPGLPPAQVSLGRYDTLGALDHLAALDADTILPGHGPVLSMAIAAAVDEVRDRTR